MDSRIRPVIIAGRTHYQVGAALFSTFRSAAQAAHAAERHQLDVAEVFTRFRSSVAMVARGGRS